MPEKSPKSPTKENLGMEGAAQDILETLLYETQVYVVGVGGCGCNTIEWITEQDMDDVKTIGINTDESVLGDLDVDRQMLIGKNLTGGEGAGGDPQIGKRAAEKNEEQILRTIEGASIVVIAAGLGGGTGSGASRVIADLAKRNGKLVVTYAIMPFSVEGDRYSVAEDHLEILSNISNATTVFENDKAIASRGDRRPEEAFKMASEMLHDVVERLKMDYMAEFFHEFGLDEMEISENLFEIEEETEEKERGPVEEEEPPVIEALRCVEHEDEDTVEMSLDSFLENYH